MKGRRKGPFPAAFVYPNLKKAALSNLGFLHISSQFEEHTPFLMEKFSIDEVHERELNYLLSCPIIFLSISWERDLYNAYLLIKKLKKKGLNDALIIAGGMGVSPNPESAHRIADAVVIGEGDGCVQDMGEVLVKFAEGELSKKEALNCLSSSGYIYVPEGYRVVWDRENMQFKVIEPLDGWPRVVRWRRIQELSQPAFREPVGGDAQFGMHLLIEISRGCPYRCAFCLVGSTCGKSRDFNEEDILAVVKRSRASSVALVAPLASSHRNFKAILEKILSLGKGITVSSLRVEDALDDELLQLLVRGGMRTLTVAPETGSDQMRRRTGKAFTSEEVLEVALKAEKAGFKTLKMYFLIGFPGEEDEHIKETAYFISRLRRSVKRLSLSVSVASFVPKPHTRWERAGMLPENELRRRIRLLKKLIPGSVRFSAESPRESVFQGVISTGGRWLSEIFESVACYGMRAGLRKEWKTVEGWLMRDKGQEELMPWELISA